MLHMTKQQMYRQKHKLSQKVNLQVMDGTG